MRLPLRWFVLVAIGSGPAQAADRPSAHEVIAAERAFAADGLAMGVGPSFVKWAAPEGVVLRPGPVGARAWYGQRPGKPGPPHLKWWPVHAGISRSGDLGFDTGPWVFGDGQAHGWFFTVWKRQPDGSWRWLIDHGFQGAPSPLGPDTTASLVEPEDRGTGSPAIAWVQVRAEEARLARALAAGRGYGAVASRRAWASGLEPAPATTPNAVAHALAARPAMTVEVLGGAASDAGDLAYAYGNARWEAAGATVNGHFVRVWRREQGRWRVLFDETTKE